MIKETGTGAAEERAQLSDEALLSRYRDLGRTEDFEALMHRYQNELYRYLTRYLGDRTLSEDVFQNTFLQIHLKRGLYEEGRPVRPGSTRLPPTRRSMRCERWGGIQRSVSIKTSTHRGRPRRGV